MTKGGKAGKSENVQVILRVRPLNKKEIERGDTNAVNVHLSDSAVTVVGCGVDERLWAFDGVYTNAFSQKDVYLQSVHPVVETVLSGYNATIFAYGQSGTGKTYSMAGNLDVPEQQGIIPHALNHIFSYISDHQTDMMEFNVFASFVELYNGKCRDLLVDGRLNLELKENAQKLFYVKDLSMHEIKTTRSAMSLMEDGLTRREVKSTELNSDSSRSHSLFSVYVRTWDKEQDLRTEAKLNLVDLAGSERQKQSGATGETLKEGNNINLSLTALGTVIDCLVKQKPHIPYRSSPLTMLLKDGLGGNSRTVIVGTIGPSSEAAHETVSTLRFIDRAKQIKNKPKVQMDPKDAKIAELLEEVKKLRRQLGLDENADASDDDGDEAARTKRKGSTTKLFDDEMEALRRRIEELEVQCEMSSESAATAESKEREFQARAEKIKEEFQRKESELISEIGSLRDTKELLSIASHENLRQLQTLTGLCVNFLSQIDKDGIWTTTVHLDPGSTPKKGGPKPPDVEDIGRGFKMFIGNGVDMKLQALGRRASFAFNHGNRTHGAMNSPTPTNEAFSPHPPAGGPPADSSGQAHHRARVEGPKSPSPVEDRGSDKSDAGDDDDPLGPAPKKKDKRKKDKGGSKKERKRKSGGGGRRSSMSMELPEALITAALVEHDVPADTKLLNLIGELLAKQRVHTSQLQQQRLEQVAEETPSGGAGSVELMAAVQELNEAVASANDVIAEQRKDLAKTKSVAEKKLLEVTQMKEHIDSLRAELNDKHAQHAAELALQQDRLVQQHSKKMEQLMNKHAKALVKERKLREAVQLKLDAQLEKFSQLEQDYDVKVMELESMTRDFEELKLESLRKYKESVTMAGNFASLGLDSTSSAAQHSQMMAQLRQSVVNDSSDSRLDRLRMVVEKGKNGQRKESQIVMPRSAPEHLPPANTAQSYPNPFSRNFLELGAPTKPL